MKGKSRWIALPCLLVATLMLASCSTSTTTQLQQKPRQQRKLPGHIGYSGSNSPDDHHLNGTTATTPTTSAANWWNSLGTPQYGGTLNFRMNANPAVSTLITPAPPMDIFQSAMGGKLDSQSRPMGLQRQMAPDDIKVGDVVDTYEIPDLSTIIITCTRESTSRLILAARPVSWSVGGS